MLHQYIQIIKTFPVFLSLILSLVQSVNAADSFFNEKENCVAYETSKKMFLMADFEIVGKSCEIATQMEWSENQDLISVNFSFPVLSLDSDNSFRDVDVHRVLKA